MQVTFCAHDAPNRVSGPNAGLQRLLPELRKRDIQSRILFMNWVGRKTPMVQHLEQQGYDVAVTLLPAYTKQLVHWIIERLQEAPPDVFVPNLAVPGFYAGKWIRKAGIPTIGVLRSDDAFHRGLQQEFIFGQQAYRLSGLVCVSKFLESQILQQQPADTLITRIPSGVPLPNSVTQRVGKTFRLVYTGRLVEQQKRISDVTRALCQVVREVSDTEAVIYGEGNARPAVEQILQDQGAGLPVRLMGRVDSNQIQAHLLQSHALVLLSDYEGVPVSVMEAMACGVVPVCLRIRSGIPELIEDGVTGLLVNDRDDDFLQAVRRLCLEPGLWEQLSRSARTKIENGGYSIEACADRWAQFLRELQKQTSFHGFLEYPRRLKLPPIKPNLAREDNRQPFVFTKLFRKIRYLAGRAKHKVLRTITYQR